jgi:hypothetical protein
MAPLLLFVPNLFLVHLIAHKNGTLILILGHRLPFLKSLADLFLLPLRDDLYLLLITVFGLRVGLTWALFLSRQWHLHPGLVVHGNRRCTLML